MARQLGGGPALPADLPWPRTSDGRALSFLARIELGSLPVVDPDLPREGRLLVFVDTLGPEEGVEAARGPTLALACCRGGEAPPRPPPVEAEEFPFVALRARRALLLQRASDGAAGFCFGAGSGRLEAGIPWAALRAGDFDAALAIVRDA